MWNKALAIAALNANARAISSGLCAAYTRRAIEAGGVTLIHRFAAKDYGSSLVTVGFRSIEPLPPTYAEGDVVIVSAFPGHPDGHMAMFNGEIWISDFRQQHGLYPGPAYRVHRPPFAIYRYAF